MYLPKSKYKEPKYTQGYEFLIPSGTPYVGWYFETYKSEYFTGKTPSENAIKLTPIDTKVSSKLTFPTTAKITNDIISPTLEDRIEGKMVRYFIQNRNTSKVFEVKKEKYNTFTRLTHILGVTLPWVIKSPSENVVVNGYSYEGAKSKNQKAVEKAEQTISNLKNYIKSYDEFVE